MFDLVALLRRDAKVLADIMTQEHGKTTPDSLGDVQRGLEVAEHACGTSLIINGQTIESISRNIDCYSFRTPLGVCAGVAPFNFPTMIPLWMFPLAITCGNTFVLKPSEKVPGAMEHMCKLLQEINLPKGVLNVVQGGFDTTKHIVHNKDIKAVSFVGGNQAG